MVQYTYRIKNQTYVRYRSYLHPEYRDAPSNLNIRAKTPRRSARRLVVKNLLVFDVIGDLALFRYTSFEVPCTGKMPGSASNQYQIQCFAVVVYTSLVVCSMYDGHNPVETRQRVQTRFELQRWTKKNKKMSCIYIDNDRTL